MVQGPEAAVDVAAEDESAAGRHERHGRRALLVQPDRLRRSSAEMARTVPACIGARAPTGAGRRWRRASERLSVRAAGVSSAKTRVAIMRAQVLRSGMYMVLVRGL